MSLQILSSTPAELDTRVAQWIKSSLEALATARTLKRVAFIMPLDGEDKLILVNQKLDEIKFGDTLPDARANDTLEVDGTFWTFIDAPEGAAEAYAILCDTQNLDPLANEIDAILDMEELADVPAPILAELDALEDEVLDEIGASILHTPATIERITMEEIDNGVDAVLADLEALNNKRETLMTDPTTATRRTLVVEDGPTLESAADAEIASEIASEIAAEDADTGSDTEEPAADATTGKTKKGRAARKPVRERIIDKMVEKLGLTALPTPEVMFAKFQNAKHVKWAKASELAVFNSTLAFDGDRTEVGKALNELADAFGSENILNESAEIIPARVLEVATALLRHGRIVHLVKAARIDPETIPASIAASHDGMDTKTLQVWDGRHRTAALVLLYGKDVKLPHLVEDKTFEEAYDDALISNDTRDYGKKEAMTYFGLTSEIQTGHDIAASFALCKGSAPAVMKWVGYHTTAKRDSDTLEPLTVPTFDVVPKGKVGMTTPSYGNIIKGAMSVYGKDTLKSLDTAKTYIDATIMVVNAAWDYVGVHAPERQNNLWTSYGTQVLGKVIGEAFAKAVAAQTEFDPTTFAETMMKTVLGFIASKGNDWNNQKPTELYVALHTYAAGKGVTLPRTTTPNAAISVLKRS